LAIIILSTYFLYDQIFYRKDISSLWDTLSSFSKNHRFYLYLSITVALIPVNMALETVKWRFLISKLEKVPFWSAFKAVLTGVAVSMFMPNRLGDYFGRVFILKKADRFQAVLSTLLGSMAQLISTLLFGFAAIALLVPRFYNLTDLTLWIYIGLLFLISITAFTLVFAYIEFAAFSDLLKRVTGREYNRIKKYAQVFSWYSSSDLWKILLLSISRYFIFSFQFFLLLKIFSLQINYFDAMMLIGMVYLLMAIIPTIALTEIGIRGSVSIYVFKTWMEISGQWSDASSLGVISASSTLWLLNLAIPALFGVLFVFNLKFFRKKTIE